MLSQPSDRRRGARLAVLASAALVLLGACGGDSASPNTTLEPLGPTNFATIPPVEDTEVDVTDVENPLPTEEVYTVQAGDVLFSIADYYGLTAQEIADYNDWEDGIDHPIYPGTEIKIPGGAQPVVTDAPLDTESPTTPAPPDSTAGGTYEVQSGDYLAGIASNFDTTAQAIADANGWSDGINHPIFPGDIINLP